MSQILQSWPLYLLLRKIRPKLRCDQIQIIEIGISSSITYNKIFSVSLFCLMSERKAVLSFISDFSRLMSVFIRDKATEIT